MKLLVRVLLVIVSLALLWWLLEVLAAESGEVVVLTTHGDVDSTQTTRLWVVDYDGATWLRAGSPQASWYQRLLARPDIEVERNAATASYTAKPEVDKRDEINRLINDKYGWADTYIGWWFGREDAVPIRLVPR
jgi:hypothetical protein